MIVPFLLIPGCAYKGSSSALLDPWDLYTAYVHTEVGKTTKREIEGWLGDPYLRTTDNLGRERWIYKPTSPFSAQTRFDVTFDREGRVALSSLDDEGDQERRPDP